MDKKLDAVDAVKTSWDMTTGHSGTLFLMFLLAIPIFFLGFIVIIYQPQNYTKNSQFALKNIVVNNLGVRF